MSTIKGLLLTGDGVNGTGTANYVSKWSDADTITNSVIYESSGNIGIGTSSPAYKLDVVGALRVSSTVLVADNTAVNFGLASQIYHNSATGGTQFTGSSGSNTLFVSDGGNVGIGTSTPSEALDLGGGVGDTRKIRFSMGGNVASIASIGSGVANGLGNLAFSTRDGSVEIERMRIDGGGNVGIGTSSPAAILDVRGTNAGSQTLAGVYANNGTTASSSVALALTTGSDGTLGRIRGQIVADSDGDNAGYLAFTTRSAGSQTERMRINASGSIKISDGTLTGGGGFEITSEAFFGASFQSGAYKFNNANNTSEYIRLDSDGLKFNGDTAAANALDDYEEGTWTPGFTLQGGSVSSFSSSGTYIKIGRQVSIKLFIVFTSTSSASVDNITNFPFVAQNTSEQAVGSIRENAATGYQWHIRVNANNNEGLIRRYDNSASISNGFTFVGTLTYFTA